MIEIKNVSKVFKKPIRKDGLLGMLASMFSFKHELKTAVNDISFEIKSGETVGYIGANGAGKSTTIKMMCGILTPTKGDVFIDGLRPYVSKERNRVLANIGVVFGQRTQLWWDLPLTESFKLLKEIYRVSDEDYRERMDYFEGIFALSEFIKQPVRTLSLGQRMRADLAAAMLHNPKILFLDEPTIGLDVVVKNKLIDAINQINEKFGTTIILTTHDMADIERVCQRVVIIDEGKILFDGTLEQIKNRFGDRRRIDFVCSAVDTDALRAEFDGVDVLEKDGGAYSVEYLADKVKTADVLGYLTARYRLDDIKLFQTRIEDVVKRIYLGEKG